MMKCTVPGSNAKIMGRALHALSRIGSVLYIEPNGDGLSFKAVNSVKSAYAVINFLPNFFTDYNLDNASEEVRDSMKCKIAIKSCLSLFKMSNLGKKVESWQIKFDMRNSKIIFYIKCRNDVMKTHYLPILDSDSLQAFYAKENIMNSLIFRTNVLLEAMNNFQATEEDVTVDVREECLFLRNYEECSVKNKILKTELKMTSDEFEKYQITHDTLISFSMKEFRAVLNFAEFLDLPVKFNFETTGIPVIFIISNDSTFEANFVMATSEPDNEDDINVRNANVDTSKSNVSATREIKKKEKMNIPLRSEPMFNFQNNVSQNSFKQNSSVRFIESLSNIPDQINSDIGGDLQSIPVENINTNIVLGSPQHDNYDKIVKKVFKRCFQATYNPFVDRPNQNEILAEDSDIE